MPVEIEEPCEVWEDKVVQMSVEIDVAKDIQVPVTIQVPVEVDVPCEVEEVITEQRSVEIDVPVDIQVPVEITE